MVTNKTLLLVFVTLASVTAQTFQYSRGWTNGKRDGNRREDLRDITGHRREGVRDMFPRDVLASLEKMEIEKIITPCQMNKLKYVLEGKPYNELLFMPCDSLDEDMDSSKQRYKLDRNNQEPLYELFQ